MFEPPRFLSACNASSNNSAPRWTHRLGRTASRIAPFQWDWSVRGVDLCRCTAADYRRTTRWHLGSSWRSSCIVLCWLLVCSPSCASYTSPPDVDIPPYMLVSHDCQARSRFHPCRDRSNFLTGVRGECWSALESFCWSSPRFPLISRCTGMWVVSTARKLAHGSCSTPLHSNMWHKADDASSRYG